MALNYNLSKVYAISDNDTEFVLQIVTLFVSEIPLDLEQVKEGINSKNHQQAYSFAHKIKPTLDLLGMTVAYEEVLLIEQWSKQEGHRKEIKETYKALENRIEKAIKEVKKDFNL